MEIQDVTSPTGNVIKVQTLFESPGSWIKVKRILGGTFTWAERKYINSVGIVAVREAEGEREVLLHGEYNPAHHELRELNWGVCGGKLDKPSSHLDLARTELREEAGIDCPVERIKPCGKIFSSTQSNEHVYLFVAETTGLKQQELDLEPSEMSAGHINKWVKINDAFHVSEDPRLIACLARYERGLC